MTQFGLLNNIKKARVNPPVLVMGPEEFPQMENPQFLHQFLHRRPI
jgi:hypothetical protein